MDEDQQDIDSAAEHQHELDQRRLREGDPDLFFMRNHDETVARQRAEAAQLKKIRYALDRMFDHG